MIIHKGLLCISFILGMSKHYW